MIKRIFIIIMLLVFIGCGKKKQHKTVEQTYPVIKEKPVVKEAGEKKKEKYRYRGAKYRDPFIPVGARAGGPGSREVDITILSLKGIIESIDTKKKYAVLSSPGGANYVVKNGKLLDTNDRVVPGISAIVRKNKVILITRRNLMRELTLRKEKTTMKGFKKEK